MQKYIAQRLLLAIPTIVGVTVLTFFGLRLLLPDSVIDVILGDFGRHDPELRQNIERDLRMDVSIFEQYSNWVGLSWFWGGDTGVLQGDLGKSLHTGRPITAEMAKRVPVSFELGLWGQLSAIVVSVPLGVWAATKQDRLPDYGFRTLALLVDAFPSFWLAILVITFGSVWFNWAPPIAFAQIYDDPWAHFKIMLLPALLIGLTPSGSLLRLVRTQMLEVLRQDYIRTAMSKGLSGQSVLYKHALRNALIPIVTVIGVGLPGIISGTVIFEQIFLIPGMGRYLVDAVNNLDYPVIQGLNLVFAVLLVFAVIAVDISYALIDPRIRNE